MPQSWLQRSAIMARQAVSILAIGLFSVISIGGCVSVDTPDTKVKVGLTSVRLPDSAREDSNATPYAKPLQRVSRQQAKVGRQLAKQDWEDVIEESSDLMADVRTLSGYAATSHDPGTFRACCQELLQHAQAVREAALVRNAASAERALAACNQPLNHMMQIFPLTRAPAGQAVSASPPPAPAPSAHPSPTPAPRRQLVP
jgi:hypothetical protein